MWSVIVSVDGNVVERSASSHRMVLVPEPLVNEARDIRGIHVGDLRGDFRAADQSAEVGGLEGIFLRDERRAVLVEQLVPVLIAGSEDLVGCDLGYGDSVRCCRTR